jgi:hypothetical protein
MGIVVLALALIYLNYMRDESNITTLSHSRFRNEPPTAGWCRAEREGWGGFLAAISKSGGLKR